MKRKIWLLLFFLFIQIGKAQSDLDKDQQLVYTYLYSKEYDQAKDLLENKFIKNNDLNKQIIGYIYMADYYNVKNDEAKKSEALEKAKNIARKTKSSIDNAYVKFGYARYYEKLNKNDLFIKYINESIKEFSKHSNEHFVLTQLYFLRFNFKSKNPLEKDIRKDAILANQHAIKSKNNILINFTYSNLGYFYKQKYNQTNKIEYIDSAKYNYQQSLVYAEKIQNPIAKKRSTIVYYLNYGSLVTTLNHQNTFDETMKNYHTILKLTENDPKFNEITAFTYNNIGSAYENKGEIDSAEKYYLKSYTLAKDNKDVFPQVKTIILGNIARIYETKNDLSKALEYERKAKQLIIESNQEQFDNNTKSLEIFYNTEKKNQQIKQLEEKNNIYSKQKFLYIGIILLAIAGIFFLSYMLYYKLKSNKQKTDLLQAERHEAELNLQLEKEEKARIKAEQELLELQQEQLNKQALAASLQLKQKNSFLNDLKEKVKEKATINLERILKDERLMDDDFNKIQNIIKDVHPSFFNKLIDVSKNKLTNQDLKYAAYLYLNMDNMQIANVMKVETKTVRMAKYRLKQKIGLEKNIDLQSFIQSLFA
ncbi:tetratricopeptide repeat protein [Empedobacter tilapiae]|uniref:Tetratricopeptide repeat protein n=1 Tax=Empedobacter tilapiae TaxID=2491114 RepID=A0A4Z1B8W3_9FLAO|nr:tetratricopeptide repeat protein [Empedobacter tilapiae]TGN26838.1 tetratricopeptide repeat protein [Empedobacter tilapiae]